MTVDWLIVFAVATFGRRNDSRDGCQRKSETQHSPRSPPAGGLPRLFFIYCREMRQQ